MNFHSSGRGRELPYRDLQFLCAADQIVQKLLVDFSMALVLGQVSLVVGLEKNLNVGAVPAATGLQA